MHISAKTSTIVSTDLPNCYPNNFGKYTSNQISRVYIYASGILSLVLIQERHRGRKPNKIYIGIWLDMVLNTATYLSQRVLLHTSYLSAPWDGMRSNIEGRRMDKKCLVSSGHQAVRWCIDGEELCFFPLQICWSNDPMVFVNKTELASISI